MMVRGRIVRGYGGGRCYGDQRGNRSWSLMSFNRLDRFSTSAAGESSSEKYCLDLVRNRDYEGYLMGLLFPHQHRRAYFAVKAFNVEIATIRDSVPRSAGLSGKLRFEFWRDTLKTLSESKPGELTKKLQYAKQPVVQEIVWLYSTHQYIER